MTVGSRRELDGRRSRAERTGRAGPPPVAFELEPVWRPTSSLRADGLLITCVDG